MESLNTNAKSTRPAKDSPTSSTQVPTSNELAIQVDVDQPNSSSTRSTNVQAKVAKPMQSQSLKQEITITPNDVLLGRGGGTNRHNGNIYYRNLVSRKQPAYVQAKKMDKSVIAKSIVANIRERNGRFLKNDAGSWVDVGDRRATEKTSQALREGLSGRMRDVVRESGVGLSTLEKMGFSIYEDHITRESVRNRVANINRQERKGSPSKKGEGTQRENEECEDARKPAASPYQR